MEDIRDLWDQATSTSEITGGATSRDQRAAKWRSLGELVDEATMHKAAAGEFPVGADVADGVSRRNFMQLLGASVALAGAAGCSRPPSQKALPYTIRQDGLTPGHSTYFATAMELDGYAVGVLGESHEGRPTKIEGNPDHPASLGATGIYEQASVLQLYDPDRARTVRRKKSPLSWDELVDDLKKLVVNRGSGIRFLLPPTASPLVGALIGRIRARLPEAKFTFHSSATTHNAEAGAKLAFGQLLTPIYDLSQAAVILAVDSDLLNAGPFAVRYARQFADRRRLLKTSDDMNRLYVVESTLSTTGTIADHRIRRRSSDIARFLGQVANAILSKRGDVPGDVKTLLGSFGAGDKQSAAVARDLERAGSQALVVVGDRQDPEAHVLAAMIHSALASTAMTQIAPILANVGEAEQTLAQLCTELRSGAVETLLCLDVNPVYDAPADLDFAGALAQVPNAIYLGLYENETSWRCRYSVPKAHYLESWGDARALDGTVSIVQPLIEPLFKGKTVSEVLSIFADAEPASAHALLLGQWSTDHRSSTDWRHALARGTVQGTAAAPVRAALDWAGATAAVKTLAAVKEPTGVEVTFHVDATVYDGRFGNVSWLQELPDPVTKLAWDNAARVSPATARDLGVADEDLITVEIDSRSITTPILIVPGQADNSISLSLGYGRDGGEQVAKDVGVNVGKIRTQAALFTGAATVKKAIGRYPLARTQEHWDMEGRPIVLSASLDEYRKNPELTEEQKGEQPTLMGKFFPMVDAANQWAMAIDLTVCTGCSACVVACQSENNILVVGKSGVMRGREMQWIRIDTYYEGSAEDPLTLHQPMACQHCEKAPCEYVCPVNATVHSPDGLNEMVYNRCVGTRFCSNNCPYKVRRFNWFKYEFDAPNDGMIKLQRNPNVTVRERGVMEKCSYCVQRIRSAEIRAEVAKQPLAEIEVVTACQQVCPTGAITFGSLTNKSAKVNDQLALPRIYSELHELGTRPRTQYLARIRNLNPEMA